MALLSSTVHEPRADAAPDRDAHLRELTGLCCRVTRDLVIMAAVIVGLWWALSSSLI